jgi:hypothetical protein
MELAYAGLQQLCVPILGGLTDLPSPRRNALEKVFGLSSGWPPDRFLVGMAVLDLAAMAAQGQSVMWIVDDAQWLDRSSVQTIAFVSRRLVAERIVIVIAARDTGEDDELAGLPELRLAGLSTEDADCSIRLYLGPPIQPSGIGSSRRRVGIRWPCWSYRELGRQRNW